MITPTLRVYMPDFIYTDREDGVIEKLTEYGNYAPNLKLYLWYNQTDKVNPKDFISKWDRVPHNNFKTIIRPQFFDAQRDFIFFDIIPKRIYNSNHIQYSRYSWVYDGGAEQILNGLEEFKKTFEFITSDKDKPKKRQQKRNDYEDSNHR